MSTPERKAGDSLQGSGQSNRPCVERCELNRGEASVNPEKELLRSSASPRLSLETSLDSGAGPFGRPPASESSEACGCGLWLCRECRPENFDPDHRLNTDGFKAGMDALANAFRDES